MHQNFDYVNQAKTYVINAHYLQNPIDCEFEYFFSVFLGFEAVHHVKYGCGQRSILFIF